jgi:hypothetical protein
MTEIFYSRNRSKNSIHTVSYSELATGSFKHMWKRILSSTSQLKLKLSICLIKHCARKMYEGVVVQLQAYLLLPLDGDEYLL